MWLYYWQEKTLSGLGTRLNSRLNESLSSLKTRLDKLEMNKCESNPCQNDGLCVKTPGGYSCICKPDFFGGRCQYRLSDFWICSLITIKLCWEELHLTYKWKKKSTYLAKNIFKKATATLPLISGTNFLFSIVT